VADATPWLRQIARLIGEANQAKIRSKSAPDKVALTETYVHAVEDIRDAMREAGKLLTKLAASAIREAAVAYVRAPTIHCRAHLVLIERVCACVVTTLWLDSMAKAKRKLYKLKARVMKRTPRETDDYAAHFPQVAQADEVIRGATEAQHAMEMDTGNFDLAQAFIAAAAACPRAVDVAALAVQVGGAIPCPYMLLNH